ncbi:hypothetical protein GCM10007389_38090 [Pontibacter akesuensis]|nr:hypothetical protein GCM10007389_38090 [Pontibacter akesuensis]
MAPTSEGLAFSCGADKARAFEGRGVAMGDAVAWVLKVSNNKTSNLLIDKCKGI